ncbi:glucose uptake inhibitor SgrT [Scandinavium sp.]|nr:glucose uptake inhibitor SgrT [Scandinavium sp.]
MKQPTVRQFYQQYFLATQGASWLARLVAGMRLKMLEDLMQWEVTTPAS